MSFEHLSYQEIYEDFINEYLVNYGKIKYEKVYNKIYTSEKISKLILYSSASKLVPNAKDYLYTINSIPFFMISKADTIALGCLMSLERWNIECNNKYKLANEFILKDIISRILKECLKLEL